LVELRHKAFAHTDASGRLPGRGMEIALFGVLRRDKFLLIKYLSG